MSLDDYIRWCKCNRRILKREQMKEGKLCDICQEEAKKHAETFKERFEGLGEETECHTVQPKKGEA